MALLVTSTLPSWLSCSAQSQLLLGHPIQIFVKSYYVLDPVLGVGNIVSKGVKEKSLSLRSFQTVYDDIINKYYYIWG